MNLTPMNKTSNMQFQNHIQALEELQLEDMFENNPNWFAFETRVRKMVIQMLEPQIKRSIQDKEIIQQMQKHHDIIKRKIDECEFVIHKAQKKTAAQEDVHKKIEFNETKQKVYEIKVKENIDKLYHQQEVLQEKVDIVEQERSSFIMRVDNLSYELKKYKEDLLNMKESLGQHIDRTHMELKKSIAGFNNQIQVVSEEIQLEKKKLVVQSNDFKKFGLVIETNNRRLVEVEDLLEKIQQEKLDSHLFTNRIAILERDLRMTQEQNLKLEFQIKDTNYFIEKYVPMQIQMMIDETLNSTLLKKNTLLKNLYEYEKNKFRLLEDLIKNMDAKNAQNQQIIMERRNYMIPNFQLRELEIQKEKKGTKGAKKGMGGHRDSKSGASKLGLKGLQLRHIQSESSAGKINTMQRSESNLSGQSKLKLKTSGKNQRKGSGARKTVAGSKQLTNQGLSFESQQNKKQNSQISGSSSRGRQAAQKINDNESQDGQVLISGNNTQRSNIKKKASQASMGKVVDTTPNYTATPNHLSQDESQSMDNKGKSSELSHSQKSQSQKSDSQSIIHQILELSEESMAESVHKSVQKRVKAIKSHIRNQEDSNNLPKIDEMSNNHQMLNEDESNASFNIRQQKKKNIQSVTGESEIQFEERGDKASINSFNHKIPLDDKSVDLLQKSNVNLQRVLEDQDNQINQSEEEGGEMDDQDMENEEDDEEEGEYSEEDSDDSSFQMTRSMIQRLQKTEVTYSDFDQAIRNIFKQYNENFEDFKTRFPAEVNHHTFNAQIDDVYRVIESTKNGIRILAEQIQQQFKEIGQQMQEDREYYQSEISASEKKRRREQFEIMQKIDELRHYVKNVERGVLLLQSKDDFYQKICLSLIEVAKVDNALMQADEVDKKSISLLGVKEENFRPTSPTHNQIQVHINSPSLSASVYQQPKDKNQQPVISIDKSCLSCSSQPYKVIAAFKMACLSYFPSQVQFQEREYNRESLIEIKNGILDDLLVTIERKIQHQEEFERNINDRRRSNLSDSVGGRDDTPHNYQYPLRPSMNHVILNSQGNTISITGNRPQSPANHRIDPKILTIEDDNLSNSNNNLNKVNFDHTLKQKTIFLDPDNSNSNLKSDSSQQFMTSYQRKSIKISNIKYKTDLLFSDQNNPNLSLTNHGVAKQIVNNNGHAARDQFSNSVILNPLIEEQRQQARMRNMSGSGAHTQFQTSKDYLNNTVNKISNRRDIRVPTDISSAPISPSHLGFTSTPSSSYVNKRRVRNRAANNSTQLGSSTNASRDHSKILLAPKNI
ncbi:UNKNOWN [Stylonychia lemnae]|uniref:Uncharacterized protein n=1 Tax=Stylonychia lemnae TaxID=5949 RepID=A0A078A1S0_STYLE|nr:UNKNOWN [Stylonychia lemnae]|eukprot:CDW76060.1 UNKNOWN [Stylonychia lemnae]